MTLEDRLVQADAEHAEQERRRKEYDRTRSSLDFAAHYLAELVAEEEDAYLIERVTARYRQRRTAYQEARDAYLGQPA